MKKVLIAVTLIASMLALAACGGAAEDGSSAETAETTAAVTETEEETTEETEEETTEEVTTEAETDAETEAGTEAPTEEEAETPNGAPDSDFVSIAGDWMTEGEDANYLIQIEPDGSFRKYYPSGILECEGSVRYEDEEIEGTVSHWYMLYDKDGEFVTSFIDDGSAVKTDLYAGNGATPHYVKVGEGGILDDGRGPGEEFVGSWGCGRASMDIEQLSDTEFHASIMWSDSAAAYVEWDYPLVYQDGKLVCDGKGTKTYVEYTDPGADPDRTVEYTDGDAEFVMQGVGLFWNDLEEHGADEMLFVNSDTNFSSSY